MSKIIDTLKQLQGALILDGYDPDDACIKMVGLFIADEEKKEQTRLRNKKKGGKK